MSVYSVKDTNFIKNRFHENMFLFNQILIENRNYYVYVYV